MCRTGVVALVAVTIVGCNFFDVAAPDRVPASSLDDPTRAPLLVQSAIADFECALTNYVAATAVLTDELIASTPFGANAWDLRNIAVSSGAVAAGDCGGYAAPPNYQYGVYTTLSIARYDADFAFQKIRGFAPAAVLGRDTLLALAAAYAGYSYTLFGEGFCQAAFDRGPALTQWQVLERAAQHFDTALAYAEAGNAAEIVNLVRVGRARVRLDIATKADSVGDVTRSAAERALAAAEVRPIPQGFVRSASRSQGYARLENAIYVHNYGMEQVSVDPRSRNPLVGGLPDPRVQAVYSGRNASGDGRTPLWYQLKYTSRASTIVLASWVEAQLIIAEAEGGQSAVDRINALRSRFTPPLPMFAGTDPTTIRNQMIEERRRELFLDGHRISDRLRFHLPWETGVNQKGDRYRTTTCLPLFSVETDNNDSIP